MPIGSLVERSLAPEVAGHGADLAPRIALALGRLTTRFPELDPLVRVLDGGTDPTEAFLAAYHASPVLYARRSLVLRVLLEDQRLLGGAKPGELTWPLRAKIARFLATHPRRPLQPFVSTFTEYDVPNHLLSAAGDTRMSAREFIGRAILAPLVDAPQERLRSPDLDRVYRASLLDEGTAHRLLHERVTIRITDAFFQTGVEAIDLQNILFFARVLLQHDPEGGRLQSKIPTTVSRRLGLNRVSVPELTVAADLIALRLAGVLGEPGAAFRQSCSGLASALEAYARWVDFEDIGDLARAHVRRQLLDGPVADDVLATKRAGIRGGTFRTGFLFNLARLLKRAEEPWIFARFVPVYDAVDTTALRRLTLSHYRQVAGDAFAEWLTHLFEERPGDFAGVHVRDLANVLFYALYHEAHGVRPAEALPSVAKYALGMPEHRPTGRGRVAPHRPRGLAPVREVALPLLDACQAVGALPRIPRQKVYLLLPGWSGSLPVDAAVCLPRWLAHSYESIPEGLRLVGPDKLPWGANHTNLSLYPELARYDVSWLESSLPRAATQVQ